MAPSNTKYVHVDADNYKSATNAAIKQTVEKTIREEIAEGNYVITSTKPTIVSALGAIPKPDSPEVRLIHDCSRPSGKGVNDYIETTSFKFQTLDDAIRLLKPNSFMAKIDLRHAYRSVPIHKSNFAATGLKWKFAGDKHYTYFYDARLPFGSKSSPQIFHRLTQAVRRMMARRGYHAIIVYLDDYLIIGNTEEECQLAFSILLKLLQDLGFEISWRKLVKPTQKLTFLGVELDTVKREMALPAEKLDELQQVISSFCRKRRTNKKQLQRLAGKLNWACRVVYGGRTFLRRIIDTMNSLSPTGKFRLTQEFRDDIHWWHSFLREFNGKRAFLSQQPITDVDTDACRLAAGAYFRGNWFYHNFFLDSPELACLHINHKEVLAQVFAATRWAHLWRNQHIIIHCDNETAVHIINKGTTANRHIMRALRHLFWLSAFYNFRFTAVPIKGKLNVIADAISRLHEPQKCIWFYKYLLSQRPQSCVDCTPLTYNMSQQSSNFLFNRFTGRGVG